MCLQSDGCGRKDHYGLIPSVVLFYQLKEIRALYPIAFEGLETGVDKNMTDIPEVILFNIKQISLLYRNSGVMRTLQKIKH